MAEQIVDRSTSRGVELEKTAPQLFSVLPGKNLGRIFLC